MTQIDFDPFVDAFTSFHTMVVIFSYVIAYSDRTFTIPLKLSERQSVGLQKRQSVGL